MTTFVLIHGGFHGGWCWKRVLHYRGHVVYTPTLPGLGERNHLATPNTALDMHMLDVVNVIQYENLEHVVLVAPDRPRPGLWIHTFVAKLPLADGVVSRGL